MLWRTLWQLSPPLQSTSTHRADFYRHQRASPPHFRITPKDTKKAVNTHIHSPHSTVRLTAACRLYTHIQIKRFWRNIHTQIWENKSNLMNKKHLVLVFNSLEVDALIRLFGTYLMHADIAKEAIMLKQSDWFSEITRWRHLLPAVNVFFIKKSHNWLFIHCCGPCLYPVAKNSKSNSFVWMIRGHRRSLHCFSKTG